MLLNIRDKSVLKFIIILLLVFLHAPSGSAQDLILDGVDTTMYGEHIYNNVLLKNGATIYVTEWEEGTQKGLLTIVANNITIDNGARIIADGSGNDGKGNGGNLSNSVGNNWGAGGGGYGNSGGSGKGNSSNGGIPYGSEFGNFVLMGSRGGNSTAAGGVISLRCEILNINGTLSSNGLNGKKSGQFGTGGASGGGILINCNSLNLTGQILANGGSGGDANYPYYYGGGGAGGRIKIIYQNIISSGSMSVLGGQSGGSGAGDGGDGTIWYNVYPTRPNFINPITNNFSSPNPIFKIKSLDEDVLNSLFYKIEVSIDSFKTIFKTYDQTLSHNGWSKTQYSSDEEARFRPSESFIGGNYQWRAFSYDGFVWSDGFNIVNPVPDMYAEFIVPILVVRDSLDFGGLAKNTSINRSVFIKNNSESVLNIFDINIDNTLYGITSDTSFSIEPGDSVEITINFMSSTYGQKTAQLSILSDSKTNSTQVVELTANILSPKLETGNSFYVGETAKNLQKDSTLTVYNNSIVPLTITDININNTEFKILSDSGFVIQGNSSAGIHIGFLSSSYGEKTANLTIYSDDPENTQQNVTLTGTVLAPVLQTTNTLFVGKTIKNVSKDTVFVLNNNSSVPLTVYGLSIDNSEFQLLGDTSYVISPYNNAEVQIRFLSVSYGQKAAILSLNSDDPESLSKNITLSATVIAPLLSVASSYSMGSTAKNDPLDYHLTLNNKTIAPLTVWGLKLDHSEFSILNDTAFTVAGNDSGDVLIRFMSADYGEKSATLSFETDDPVNSTKNVLLTSTVLAPVIYSAVNTLSFGPIQRGFSKERDITIENTSTVQLTVTDISINNPVFKYTGSSSFTIDPNSSETVKITAFSQNLGIESGVLSIASDDPNNPVIQITLNTEIREVDTTSPELAGITAPTEVVSGAFNTIQVSVSASDNEELIKVLCFYKAISVAQWDSVVLDKSGNAYSASIPFSSFDELGLEYYFLLRDWVGNEKQSNVSAISLAFVNTGLIITDLKYGDDRSDYQIISFPLTLNKKDIIGTLENDLGTYNKKKWRLFQYNNGENVEVGADLLNFELGQGYWLIIKDASDEIDSGEGTTFAVPSDSFFVIRLEPGWNQIGNPFPFDISWAKIKSFNNNNPLVGVFKSYESGWIQTDSLKVFSGGFVFADETVDLKIPPIKEQNSFNKSTRFNPIINDENNWLVSLSVTTSDQSYDFAGFGMNEDASELKDPYDDMTLPRFSDYLEVNFYHPEYFYPKFTKDVVPTSENHIWEFSVESSFDDKKTEIRWGELGFFEEKNLILFDIERQKRVNMLAEHSYQFSLDKSKKFKVYYGDDSFIDENLFPDRFVLLQNYPNPFNSTTYFEFTIPGSFENAKIVLSIYNVMGQEIKTLLDNEFNPGFYKVTWNGKNNTGSDVSSGIYFSVMKIFNRQSLKYTKQMKLVYLK